MLPITLSVKRETWRLLDEDVVPSDAEFKRVRLSRLQKDDQTCQFCGWRSSSHMDVHHVNDSHDDNSIENLATACKICHACHHIGFAAMGGKGSMIYLPDITQNMLNKLLRVIYVINTVGSDQHKQFASTLWKMLMAHKRPVVDAWGTADPVKFANKMLALPNEVYERRGDSFLSPLRVIFLPTSPMIAPALDTWTAQYGKLPSSMWMEICDEVMGRLTSARERIEERLRVENAVFDGSE
jgi:intracellular multiplication protein IcmJ